MKKIIEYLPFYLMLSICAGICIENNMDIQELSLQKSYLYIIIIIIFLYFIMNKIGHLLFMLIVILLFIGVGFLASFFNNPINYSNYYKKIPLENKILTLQIKEKLNPFVFENMNENEKFIFLLENMKSVSLVAKYLNHTLEIREFLLNKHKIQI